MSNIKTTVTADAPTDIAVKITVNLRDAAMLRKLIGRTRGTELLELFNGLGDIPAVRAEADRYEVLDRNGEQVVGLRVQLANA